MNTRNNRESNMSKRSVYERFDAVMQKAAKEPTPVGHKAMIERLSDLAQYLPQFPAIQRINPAQHITWARNTLMTELTISMLDNLKTPGHDVLDAAEQEEYETAWKQCLWHLRRASGIGGSEIGTIVQNLSRGEAGDFGSAHNTVKEKLLMLSPQIGEPAMRRGHQMEDYVRAIHHKGSGEVEDVNSLNALRGFRSPDHPFIIGTPDDITLRVKDGVRERVLLDYKCPGEKILDKYKKDGVPFGYVAQLHHYHIVAKDAKIKINAFQLVPFDYHGGAKALVMPVAKDESLEKEIEDTAKIFWEEFVMRGEIPPPMKAPEIKVDNPDVTTAMQKAGIMLAISNAFEKRYEEMKREAVLTASQNTRALGQINAGFYYISRDAKWDEAALRELAPMVGIDADEYYVPSTGKVNQKAAAKMLAEVADMVKEKKPGSGKEILKKVMAGTEEALIMEMDLDRLAEDISKAGLDVTSAYEVSERSGLTMKRKGPEAEEKANVMIAAATLLEEVNQVVESRIIDFIGDANRTIEEENNDSMSF